VTRHSPIAHTRCAFIALLLLVTTASMCFAGPSAQSAAVQRVSDNSSRTQTTEILIIGTTTREIASNRPGVISNRKRGGVPGSVALLPSILDMARAWAARLNADPRATRAASSPEASLKMKKTERATQQGNGSLTDLRNGYSAGGYTGVSLTRQLGPKLSATLSRMTNDSGSVYGLPQSKTTTVDVVSALPGNRAIGVGFTNWTSTASLFGGIAQQRNMYASFRTPLNKQTSMTLDCGVISSNQEDIGASQARYAGIGLRGSITKDLSLGAAFRRNDYSSYFGSQTAQSGNAMDADLYWTPSATLAIDGRFSSETTGSSSPTRFSSPSLSVRWLPSSKMSLSAQIALSRFGQSNGLTNTLSSQKAGCLSLSLSRKISTDTSFDVSCDLAGIAGMRSPLGGYGISYRTKM
jgi:hypothetical protein